MTRVRARGEDVRRYIIDSIEKHPSDVAKQAADYFDITRQAVNKHLRRLIAEKVVTLLGESGVPFSEVSAHRATLEQAYMELTRDAVEFRAASTDSQASTEEAAR